MIKRWDLTISCNAVSMLSQSWKRMNISRFVISATNHVSAAVSKATVPPTKRIHRTTFNCERLNEYSFISFRWGFICFSKSMWTKANLGLSLRYTDMKMNAESLQHSCIGNVDLTLKSGLLLFKAVSLYMMTVSLSSMRRRSESVHLLKWLESNSKASSRKSCKHWDSSLDGSSRGTNKLESPCTWPLLDANLVKWGAFGWVRKALSKSAMVVNLKLAVVWIAP